MPENLLYLRVHVFYLHSLNVRVRENHTCVKQCAAAKPQVARWEEGEALCLWGRDTITTVYLLKTSGISTLQIQST